jgi:hypothetical protein
MANEIGLQFILLDEVFIAIEIDAPIDVPGIIAGHIFAMTGELDCKSRQRRLMGAGKVADDQVLRLNVPAGDMGQNIGVEITG